MPSSGMEFWGGTAAGFAGTVSSWRWLNGKQPQPDTGSFAYAKGGQLSQQEVVAVCAEAVGLADHLSKCTLLILHAL